MAKGAADRSMLFHEGKCRELMIEDDPVPCRRRVTFHAAVGSHDLLKCPLMVIGMTGAAQYGFKSKDRSTVLFRVAFPARQCSMRAREGKTSAGVILNCKRGRSEPVLSVTVGAIIVTLIEDYPMNLLMAGGAPGNSFKLQSK